MGNKKIITVILFLFCAVLLFSAEKIKIGIILQIGIPPFKAQIEGFSKEIAKAGFTKENTEIIEMNAEGNMDRIKGITDDLRKAKVKLITVIGTSAAIETLKYVKDIPVVASVSYAESLTEAGAKFKYGKNYTAGLMYLPHLPLIKLALKTGKYKTFGMIYNSNEDNSKKEVENLVSACKDLNLKSVALPYSDEKALVSTLKNMIDSSKIDCVLFTKDTLLVKHLSEIISVINQKKIPAITIDEGSIDAAIIGLSMDHYDLGVILSNIAVDILKGGKKPADIAPRAIDKYMVLVNLKVGKAIGVNIPIELIRAANKVIKE